MYAIGGHYEGLEVLHIELLDATSEDLLSPIAKAAEKIERKMYKKLSSRASPSRPGEPPAMVTGDLRDGIGRTGPWSTPGKVSIAVGYGVGDEAMRRVRETASKRGMEVGELFGKANIHEYGGFDADGRRVPQRSYVRSTFDEMEAEVVADIRRAL